jgi:hypothetical protein
MATRGLQPRSISLANVEQILVHQVSCAVTTQPLRLSHTVYNCPFSATFRVTNTCSCEMLICPVPSSNVFI